MFEDKIAPRKFRKHVTRVQMNLEEKAADKSNLTEEVA